MKKSTKRVLSLVILTTFLFALSINLASAQPINDAVIKIQEVGKAAFELVKPLLEAMVGDVDKAGIAGGGELFTAKVLFMILIFSILWAALERVDFFAAHTWVRIIVSISATVLSIRIFVNDWAVRTVLLPYSVLGIALTAGLPFVVFVIITMDWRATYRKISWIFFATIFTALWFTRMDDIGDFGFIYLVAAGLALLMLIFDGTVKRFFQRTKVEEILGIQESKRRVQLIQDRIKLENEKATTPPKDYRRLDTALKKLEKDAGIIS